jgi:hypothetical protein
VYVLAIIKNVKEMWDQAKNPGTSPEKKARPLFSAGEGRKRESGVSVWNKEGLEFYYTAEKNLERGVQFQGAIFHAGQWVGELGAKGQEQEGCYKYKNILDEGRRRGQQDEQREELTPRKSLVGRGRQRIQYG